MRRRKKSPLYLVFDWAEKKREKQIKIVGETITDEGPHRDVIPIYRLLGAGILTEASTNKFLLQSTGDTKARTNLNHKTEKFIS